MLTVPPFLKCSCPSSLAIFQGLSSTRRYLGPVPAHPIPAPVNQHALMAVTYSEPHVPMLLIFLVTFSAVGLGCAVKGQLVKVRQYTCLEEGAWGGF